MLLTPSLTFLMLQGTTPIIVQADRLRRDPKAVVCRNIAKTNTRFPKRICHDRGQWDEMARQGRRDAEEILNKPVIGQSGN